MGCKGDDVEIYDSLQTTLNLESEAVIARYLHSKSSHIVLKFVNITMQSGSTECGLYTVAVMTALAFRQDPALLVFDQNSLRTHLGEYFQSGYIQLFPAVKMIQIKDRIKKEKMISIYYTADCLKMIICLWYDVIIVRNGTITNA